LRAIPAAGIAALSALWVLVLPAAREACAQEIVLNNTRGLDFGRFAAGAGGTVVISPEGLRSRTGGVVLLNSPDAGQAMFIVSKSAVAGDDGGKAVIISLPPNGSIRLSSGSNSMAVDGFGNSPNALLAIPASGTTLSVGATLTVAPNQAPGNYSGSFPLIVNYQ
jgi:hypothetical protein